MKNFLLSITLFVFNFASGQIITSDCTDSFVVSNKEQNKSYTYNAQNSIIAQNNYEASSSNNEIKMKAGNVIVLKPNTYIKKGSLYLAQIKPCTNCEKNFSYSNFFTPNGDSHNDYWKVEWINSSDFSEVSIFDRYGKLIKILNNINDSWDGMQNAVDVLSSDYWFKLRYTDCYGNKKEYRSHFSLKR